MPDMVPRATEDQEGIMAGRMKIFSGSANRPLALRACKDLRTKLSQARLDRFADGEIWVKLGENVRGEDVFIIQPTFPPAENLFELLLLIPVKPRENGFWFSDYDEFKESAFNTWDFEKMHGPFDKYGYRVKKVLEQVKDLALLHSCISQPEGRKNIRDRFELVLNEEFRNPLLEIVERYRKTFNEERRAELRRKIAKLSQHIMECKRIWEKYSPWEDTPTSQI